MGNASSVTEFGRAVSALLTQEVKADDHAVWHAVFGSHVSQGDVHALLRPQAVRTLRRDHPDNLALALYKCIEQLEVFLAAPVAQRSDPRSATNALVILARVLPYATEKKDVFEGPTPQDDVVIPDRTAADVPVACSPYSANFAHQALFENKTCKAGDESERFPLVGGRVLGERLMKALTDICFVPGFTIGDLQHGNVDAHPRFLSTVSSGLLWCAGASTHASSVISYSQHHVANRLLCIRTIIAVLSAQCYQQDPTTPEPFRGAMLDADRNPLIGTLVCSLFNFMTHYRPRGSLPYTSHWITGNEDLTYKCAALLAVLLDYEPFYAAADEQSPLVAPAAAAEAAGEPQQNTHRDDAGERHEDTAGEFGDTHDPAPPPPPPHEPSDDLAAMIRRRAAAADPGAPQTVAAVTDDDVLVMVPDEGATMDDAAQRHDVHRANSMDSTAGAAAAATESVTAGGSRVPSPVLEETRRRALSLRLEKHGAWAFVARCREEEFEEMLLGFAALVENPVEAHRTYLPRSQRELAHEEEFVVLLWKLLDRCPRFLQTFVRSRTAVRFVLPILYFGLGAPNALTDDSQFSNLQLMLFMLMRLSCSRQWCLACNTPCTEYIPLDIPLFDGTYCDAVILALYGIIMRRKSWLAPLHESCASIICNISPFAPQLSGVTSSKMVQLIEIYAEPANLRNPGAPEVLAFAVESVVNQLQYQPAKSIIYNVLYREKAIRTLYEGLKSHSLPVTPEIARRMHVYTLICALEAASEAVNGKKVHQPLPEKKSAAAAVASAMAAPLKAAAASVDPDGPKVDAVAAIEKLTLVGALPVPHAIVVRHFISRKETDTWLTSWAWACVYMHFQPSLVDIRTVELFRLRP